MKSWCLRSVSVAVGLLAATVHVSAEIAEEVSFIDIMADIHANTEDSAPAQFVDADTLLFFTAEDGGGRRLFGTDGNAKDIDAPGNTNVYRVVGAPVNPSLMTLALGVLFFEASNTLWRAEGSGDDLQAVQLPNAGTPTAMVGAANALVYAREDGTNLWILSSIEGVVTNFSGDLLPSSPITELVVAGDDRVSCIVPVQGGAQLWTGSVSHASMALCFQTNQIEQLQVGASNEELWMIGCGNRVCRWHWSARKLACSEVLAMPVSYLPVAEGKVYCHNAVTAGFSEQLLRLTATGAEATILDGSEALACSEIQDYVCVSMGALVSATVAGERELHFAYHSSEGSTNALLSYDINPITTTNWTGAVTRKSSSPANLCRVDDGVLFSADDGGGESIMRWQSRALTKLVRRAGAPALSSYAEFAAFRHSLFFSASSESCGAEPYRLAGHAAFVDLGALLSCPDPAEDETWYPFVSSEEGIDAAIVVTNAAGERRVLFTDPGAYGVAVQWIDTDGVTQQWEYVVTPSAYDEKALKRLYHTEDASKAPTVDLASVPYDANPCNNSSVIVAGTSPGTSNSMGVAFEEHHSGHIWMDENDRLHADIYDDDTGRYAGGSKFVIWYSDGNGCYIDHEVIQLRAYHPDDDAHDMPIGGDPLGPLSGIRPDDDNGMPYVAEGKMENRDDDGFIYQHVDQGDLNGNLYVVRENPEDETQMEVFWMREGLHGVAWPYEMDRFTSYWDTNTAQRLVRRRDSDEPRVVIPPELSPYKMPAEEYGNEAHEHGYLQGNEFYSNGDGFSLLLLESGPPQRRDWLDFVVVNSIWHDNTAPFAYSMTNGFYDVNTAADGECYTNQAVVTSFVGDRITNAYHRGAACGYIYHNRDVPGDDLYHPGFYGDAMPSGMHTGHVFAVNEGTLEVWWSNVSHTNASLHGVPGAEIQWPSYVTRCSNTWQDPCPRQIRLADEEGTGKISYPGDWHLYYQNDPDQPGYNPNDEHALVMITKDNAGVAAFPLRCDLYKDGHYDSSKPHLLIGHVDAIGDQSVPSIDVYAVAAGQESFVASNNLVGMKVSAPYPLESSPFALCSNTVAHATETNASALWRDRKQWFWARADGGDKAATNTSIRYYYNLLSSFHLPQWYRDLAAGVQDKIPPGVDGRLGAGDQVPWLDVLAGDGHVGTPADYFYDIDWPADVPPLYLGQTLSKPIGGLPAIWEQRGVEIVYQQCSYSNEVNTNCISVALVDPMLEHVLAMTEAGEKATLSSGLKDLLLQTVDGKSVFKDLPAHLRERLLYDEVNGQGMLRFAGRMIEPSQGNHYLLLNTMSSSDVAMIHEAFDGVGAYGSADDRLRFQADVNRLIEKATNVTYAVQDRATANTALSTGPAEACGYVTVAFNNSTNPEINAQGDPVSVRVILVTNELYIGQIFPMTSDNPFDEQHVMRHTPDFGGYGGDYRYEWYYLPTNSYGVTDRDYLAASEENSPWKPATNLFLHGGVGETELILRDYPEFVLEDCYVTCRYRPLNPAHPHGTEIPSAFAPPKLAESWVKRVLAGINPFEQRVKSFDSYAPDTSLTMLEEIGGPYLGPVPLNLDHVDDYGLTEIYATVFDRAMDLSYGSNDPDDHKDTLDNTLLLAAGRLADLDMVLGNEAYADAADPTIGFGTEHGEYGSMASSIFCFQNITPSLLDEELALLRGRAEDQQPSTKTSPFFNRLPWNMSRDVVGGEVAYALNYELRDVTNPDGDGQDGFIDEYDAARIYPQGHGDAWGYYLSAIKRYYTLLRNPAFQWAPRMEAVTLNGQNLDVDYLDERKFAAAAAARARTGAEIVDLTYRSAYTTDPAGHWSGYLDSNTNRAWGAGEWTTRTGQGAYFDWISANAMLPVTSTNIGIAKVDRTSVTEIGELASQAGSVQQTVDNMDGGLNPLGLDDGVIPFDISPAEIDQGRSHYEQVYARALQALSNAKTVFDFAQNASQQLRRQFDSHQDFVQSADDREFDFENRLIELYGYPYEDDIGPGRTYPQGYLGPDYFHYNYVDLSDLLGVVKEVKATNVTITVKHVNADGEIYEEERTNVVHFTADDMYWEIKPTDWSGGRRAPGELQMARGDLIAAIGRLLRADVEYDNMLRQIEDQAELLRMQFDVNAQEIAILNQTMSAQEDLNTTITRLRTAQSLLRKIASIAPKTGEAAAEAPPKVFGVIAGIAAGTIMDPGMGTRAAIRQASVSMADIMMGAADVLGGVEQLKSQAKEIVSLESNIRLTTMRQGLSEEQAFKQLEQLVRQEASSRIGLYTEMEAITQSAGRYMSAVQKAKRLEAERLRFRKQTAAQIQDYRYKDMAFRIFRNDALQKYRAQFDMAARYAYLTVRAYEYETCMLGDDWGDFDAHTMLERIVQARTIGHLENGVPLWSDDRGGIAGVLGELDLSWFVLGPQLGFNNPQTETGRFSLRSEMFRILPGYQGDDTWREQLRHCKVPNILALPEFQRYCIPFNPTQAEEPGLVIPFSTTVNFGHNYFGWLAGGGDNSYDSANFATKIRSVGIWFSNYNNIQGGGLLNTPRVYLVPVGTDILRKPLGDRGDIVEFDVVDQALPMPFGVLSSDLENPGYIPMHDSLWDSFAAIRRHSAIRAYHDSGMFNEAETINDSRLIGRSVWNTRWLLIIPAGTLHSDREEGLERFINGALIGDDRDGNGVKDIKIFFQTYAYPGI